MTSAQKSMLTVLLIAVIAIWGCVFTVIAWSSLSSKEQETIGWVGGLVFVTALAALRSMSQGKGLQKPVPRSNLHPDQYHLLSYNYTKPSPREFELSCKDLFKKMGYQVQITAYQNDGGYDLKMFKGTHSVIVECKCYSNPVGVEIVRSLLGVYDHERPDEAWLVTSSRFTKGAIEFSKWKPLKLIDGKELRRLHERYGKENESVSYQT